ncbi:hypothetical protein [Azospirillum sp. TSO5]|uniref:hypothetical protein n=1 Tax=Azospirillum sp. TSO5 TaxID=716760 RepID=UPI000D652EA5|nr:hypothetical protein [Azospirillum sp. TSO5]
MKDLLMGIMALVVLTLVGAAGVMIGGPMLTSSAAKANAVEVHSKMAQLAGLVTLYRSEKGALPATGTINSTHALVTGGYLKSAPLLPTGIASSGNFYSLTGTAVTATVTSQDVCDRIGLLGDASITCTWTIGTGPGAVAYAF